jgi:hypothetical protein
MTTRPTLTQATVVEYIDWVMANEGQLSSHAAERHLKAAELVVRTMATEAQGKLDHATRSGARTVVEQQA